MRSKLVPRNSGMIALDTNVLVRFLTQDEPGQGALAAEAMSALTSERPGFVGREVLIELVWVLERAYKYSRSDIVHAIEALFSAAEVVIEVSEDLGGILRLYEDEGFGFADLMIRQAAFRSGADTLLTFDKKAADLDGVTLLGESKSQ